MSDWDLLGLLLLPVYLVVMAAQWLLSLPRRLWQKVRCDRHR